MGDPHGDPQTSPQHADPHRFLVWFSLRRPQVHADRRIVGWSAGRHVDHPCGWQLFFCHGLLEKSLNREPGHSENAHSAHEMKFLCRIRFDCFRSQVLSGPVRDTPHIAQYLFEIVSQRGVSHPFALLSCGIARKYRRDTPFVGGYRASTSHALQGGNSQKRGRGIAPNWPC